MKLAEEIGLISRTATRVLRRYMAQTSSRSYQQLRALRAIQKDEIHTQVELAERLLIDAPAASRLVDRLESAGLLERCEGENRRCVRLKLTKKAGPEVNAMNGGVDWLEEELRRCLTEKEAETLQRLLRKLNERLSESMSGDD